MNLPAFQFSQYPRISWMDVCAAPSVSLRFDEHSVLESLVSAHNEYMKLDSRLDDEDQEFKLAIHAAQRIIGTRVARRANPEIWRQE